MKRQQEEQLPQRLAPASRRAQNLLDFILYDNEPNEGFHVVASFLVVKDLLQLSETCQTLLHYRNHMTRIHLLPEPKRDQEEKEKPTLRTPNSCLGAIRGAKPVHLKLNNLDALRNIPVECPECLDSVRVIDVTEGPDDQVAELISHIPLLQEICLEDVPDPCKTILAIGRGKCPDLRKISAKFDDDFSISLILSCLYFPKLEILKLDGGLMGTGILDALQHGNCPNIKELELPRVRDESLAGLLRSGKCPKIQKLPRLIRNGRESFQAIADGACPDLRSLDTDFTPRNSDLLMAIMNACPKLEHLTLEVKEPCTREFLEFVNK